MTTGKLTLPLDCIFVKHEVENIIFVWPNMLSLLEMTWGIFRNALFASLSFSYIIVQLNKNSEKNR